MAPPITLIVSLLLVSCLTASCKGNTASTTSENKSYAGYTLLTATPQNSDQLEGLIKLQRLHGVDFWLPPAAIGRHVSILVSPETKSQILELLRSKNISGLETIENVGEEIERSRLSAANVNRQFEFLGFGYGQRPNSQSTIPQLKDSFFADYQRYETIERKMNQYNSRPEVETKLLGYSSQNRSIYLVKVSSDSSKNKPVILIDAGHHAREWISHSTIMFMIDNLLRPQSGATNNKNTLASKLNNYDFWFVPTVNPDGYEYSHSHDRMWRKTRSKGRVCEGADPNRNYNDHWGGSGSSKDECSLIYAGKRAESEIEVKHISQLLYSNRNRIVMYLSLHSFSQMILWPYGYANVAPHNERQLQAVASAGITGIRQYRGTSYTMGRVANVLYPASGGSDDYAMAACGIPFVYTIELPDKGWRGFILPTSEIIPVGVETEQGIAAMVDKMSEFL